MHVLWYFLDNSTSKSLIVQIVKQALNPSLLFYTLTLVHIPHTVLCKFP